MMSTSYRTALPAHCCNHFSTHCGCTANVTLIHVIHANPCHWHSCSCEVLFFVCCTIECLSPHDLENCPWYKTWVYILIIRAIACNLFDATVFSKTCSTHQFCVIIEACFPAWFLKSFSAFVKRGSFTVQKQVSCKVLNGSDRSCCTMAYPPIGLCSVSRLNLMCGLNFSKCSGNGHLLWALRFQLPKFQNIQERLFVLRWG